MMSKKQIKSKQVLGSALLVLTLFLLCSSCSKDEDPEINDLLIGTWEWLETNYVMTGIKDTPDTEGYTQTSIYKNDKTVESYKDGGLVGIESYLTREIIYEPQDPNSETAMVLIINDSESYFLIGHDTLTISQAHIDGPVIIYKRID